MKFYIKPVCETALLTPTHMIAMTAPNGGGGGGGGDARQRDEELEEQEAFEQFVIETENGGKTNASLW